MFYEVKYKNYNLSRYMINKNGEIYSKIRKRILKPLETYKGYYVIDLQTDENIRIKSIFVHRIMGYTFLGYPKNDNYVIDHINGNRKDNRVQNLRWLTKTENNQRENLHYNKFSYVDLRTKIGIKRFYLNKRYSRNELRKIREKIINGDTSYLKKSNNSKFSDEIIEKICLLKNDGFNSKEIYEKINKQVPIYTINDIIQRRSYTRISSKYNWYKKLSEDEKNKVIKYFYTNPNATREEVTKKFNITREQFFRYRRIYLLNFLQE